MSIKQLPLTRAIALTDDYMLIIIGLARLLPINSAQAKVRPPSHTADGDEMPQALIGRQRV